MILYEKYVVTNCIPLKPIKTKVKPTILYSKACSPVQYSHMEIFYMNGKQNPYPLYIPRMSDLNYYLQSGIVSVKFFVNESEERPLLFTPNVSCKHNTMIKKGITDCRY